MVKFNGLFLALSLFFATSSYAQEAVRVCGQYQRFELPNNSHWAAIVDYKAYSQGITYAITNPADAIVGNMVKGYCYCVTGQLAADSSAGDGLYHSLAVTAIVTRPYFNCH